MKRTRKRLTARDLMIAVLAFALSLKLGLAYGRSPVYWREARFHGEAAKAFRFYAGRFEDGNAVMVREVPGERQEAAVRARHFAAESDRKRSIYLRAAIFPWLPTSPNVREP